jgi:hypothetical protein
LGLVIGTLLVVAAVYSVGLTGPFLLDDFHNLQAVIDWNEGRTTLSSMVLNNQSGPLGRPVAMLSFAASSQVFGVTSFGFKIGNLLLHLLIGALIWRLSIHFFARDRRLSDRAQLLAALVAAIWLLHPLNVSTVLYAVQRMAQLSALFALLAVLAYVRGRLAIEAGRQRTALLWLFAAFPCLLVIGLGAKENAAVAVALCLAIEITLFGAARRERRIVGVFFMLFLALPALVVLALLALRPEMLIGGYDGRAFTLAERLLTQPRVLIDYLGLILFPNGPRMGLYTDDFPLSSAWLTPPSTLIAITAMAGVTLLTWMGRRKAPIVACGWLIFLAGHLVESTFLPLEIHFEHRNYLPMVGILLAGVAAAAQLMPAIVIEPLARARMATVLTVAMLAVLAFVTLGRVLVWGSAEAIARQGVLHNPESLRAHADLASWLTREGRHEEAIAVMLTLSRSHRPINRVFGHVGVVTSQCLAGRSPDLSHLDRAVDAVPSQITSSITHAVSVLMAAEREGKCEGLPRTAIADAAAAMLAKVPSQSPTSEPIWLLNHYVALLWHAEGRDDRALPFAQRAWVPDRADPPVGELLVRLFLAGGDLDKAERTAHEVLARLDANDGTGRGVIEAHLDLVRRLRGGQAGTRDAGTNQ